MDDKNTLTRADLANEVTEVFRVSKFEALDFVEEMLDEITKALVEGENVKITGFGNFVVHQKEKRMGRNPKTLDDAVIEARKVVSFKPSAMLRKKVNGGI